MIDKARLGVEFFDARFGGIYRRRSTLCVGRHGSGKTVLAIQSLMQCVREDERSLMLSSWRAPDLIITAEQMGFPLSDAVSTGKVVLLEYGAIMPTPAFEKSLTLPPGSFMELQDIIEANSTRRVVIDTVLPWVAIPEKDKLVKHVYSFIHSLERMGVTSLLTLPRPVSPMAFALRNALEELIPVVFTLDQDEAGHRSLLVNKYLGHAHLPPLIPITIQPGVGISLAPGAASARSEPAPFFPSRPPEPQPAVGPPEPKAPIRYASAFRKRL